jgi:hypothetical protein
MITPDKERTGHRPDAAQRTPEPSFGPDEEGELPLAPDAVGKDKAAWVHQDRPGSD